MIIEQYRNYFCHVFVRPFKFFKSLEWHHYLLICLIVSCFYVIYLTSKVAEESRVLENEIIKENEQNIQLRIENSRLLLEEASLTNNIKVNQVATSKFGMKKVENEVLVRIRP